MLACKLVLFAFAVRFVGAWAKVDSSSRERETKHRVRKHQIHNAADAQPNDFSSEILPSSMPASMQFAPSSSKLTTEVNEDQSYESSGQQTSSSTPPVLAPSKLLHADAMPLFSDQPSSIASQSPSPSAENAYNATNRIQTKALIGVFYYPWYDGTAFNGAQYMRRMLKPPQKPALGQYNDRDPSVIAQHLKWCKQAGIGLWVTSWWGPSSRTDVGVISHILPHPDLGGMKIALFYETEGRIPNFSTGSPDMKNVASDISYMAKTYFNHPNYLRVDNIPVLVIYLSRAMPALANVINAMREAARSVGSEIYIIGDHAFGKAPKADDALNYLDGVTNYDSYGSLNAKGYYAGQSTVDAYFAEQKKWRALANAAGKSYIVGITPGYNDRGVRNVGHPPLSRKLDSNSEFGSLFRSMLQQALPLVNDRSGRMLLINSWNEWHEDTMIEPILTGTGVTNVDVSTSGDFYTQGVDYDDYGELYLNILRQETGLSNPVVAPVSPPMTSRPVASPVTSSPVLSPITRAPVLGPPACVEQNNTLVGAFYYPYYVGTAFNGAQYMRRMLQPPQLPALGQYNGRDPSVISQHLKWCKQAGIGLLVTSWWGPNSRTDVGILSHILPHPDLGNMKLALFYETVGRIPNFSTASPDLKNVATDMTYMAKTYFNHPNYLRIDGLPVFVMYLSRATKALANVVNVMRQAARSVGFEIYIIGDHAFGKAPMVVDALNYLDGIANYDVYGSLNAQGYYAGQSTVDAYFAEQKKWRALANAAGKSYTVGITPGFNDKGVRNVRHMPLSRQLDSNSDFGSLFRSMLQQALPLVDDRSGRMLLITSFNEWMEDTMIEPTVGSAGVTNVDISASGNFYTEGVDYDDYGELFLNILQQESGNSYPCTPAPPPGTTPTAAPIQVPPSAVTRLPIASPAPLPVPVAVPIAIGPSRLFDRFLIIVLENQNYQNVLQDPYFNSLASQGALMTNFDALRYSNSFPNYIGMVAGSTFGAHLETTTFDEPTIADLLEKKGLSWKLYGEEYPGNCYLGSSKNNYVRRHMPFLAFPKITNDLPRCTNHIVPSDQFLLDWNAGQLPNYSMFIPSNIHNSHDSNISVASKWLREFLNPLLANSNRMQGTLIEITFDEVAKGTKGFHIYTVFLGPMISKGTVIHTAHDHYSALRTVEDNFQLGTLGQYDATATAIDFRSGGSAMSILEASHDISA